MGHKTTVRLYEGFHFKLTPEQCEAIGEALKECEEMAGTEGMGATLAQISTCADGVYCTCHCVSKAKATVIKDVLASGTMFAIKVDAPKNGGRG